MSKVLQIPGRFRYRAIAVPKGARNERYVLMHGPMLVEIEDAGAVMRKDAVRVRTHEDEEVAYAMHQGRLWRPAFPHDPVTLEDYACAAAAWPTVKQMHFSHLQLVERPLRALQVDPVAAASEFREASPWPQRGGMALHDEATFEGRVCAHDRTECLSRCMAAAKNVVAADGIVYVAVPDPVWEVGFDGGIRMTSPEPAPPGQHDRSPREGNRCVEGWRCFDLRRLDAARAFAVRIDPGKPHPVEGDALRDDPDYVPPPAMSRAVQDAFHAVLSGATYEVHRHLSARGLRAVADIQGAAESVSAHGLGDLATDPEAFVEALREIAGELRSKLWPGPIEHSASYMLRGIERTLDRADFERSWRPALVAEDEASLGALAP